MFAILKKIFNSEKIIMVDIFLMAIVILLLSFPSIKEDDNSALYKLLCLTDNLLIIFFIIEAIVKIAISRRQYFKSGWNIFDFFIVIFSLPSLIGYSSIIVLGRLLRLFRIMRFLTFIPHMEQLLTGLMRAFRASVFVLIILLAYNFVIAIFNCHFFGASKLFSDPIISFFTTFQLFTLEGWNEIPQRIIKEGDYPIHYANMIRFYFIVLVLTGGIFGLSIANAVFVDEMTIDNNIELERKVDKLFLEKKEKMDILEEKIDRLLLQNQDKSNTSRN